MGESPPAGGAPFAAGDVDVAAAGAVEVNPLLREGLHCGDIQRDYARLAALVVNPLLREGLHCGFDGEQWVTLEWDDVNSLLRGVHCASEVMYGSPTGLHS